MVWMSGTYREQSFTIQVIAEDGGYGAIISKARLANGALVSQEEWRRLDRPRPTARLAMRDAHELVMTLIDEATEEHAASVKGGTARTMRRVTPDEIIARVRAEGRTGIGDGLHEYLGGAVTPYVLGYQRGLEDLPPPLEIVSPAFHAGYEDGQAAYPALVAAHMLSTEWRNRAHLRDHQVPEPDRPVLMATDEFADYTIVRMRVDIQPVFEPGSEPADPDDRKVRVRDYLRATALLHERPVRCAWLGHSPSASSPIADRDFLARIASPGTPREIRRNPRHGRTQARLEDGQLELTVTYDRPGDEKRPEYVDPAWVLAEAKRQVRSAVVALEERRRERPDAFVRDPVTTNLQQRAASLRALRDRGPTQIPELTDQQVANLGPQGPATRDQVRAWNENSRRGHAQAIAGLSLLEAQIRARGADPANTGGWEDPAERPSALAPREGRPALGWEPVTPSGLTDEYLLLEISGIVERLYPGEFDTNMERPGVIAIRPRHPQPVIHEWTTHATSTRTPDEYQRLMSALQIAGGRWRVRLWAIPHPAGADPAHQWIGHSSVRWRVSMQPDSADRKVTYTETADGRKMREELMHIEVQLAPQGSRTPVEWEC